MHVLNVSGDIRYYVNKRHIRLTFVYRKIEVEYGICWTIFERSAVIVSVWPQFQPNHLSMRCVACESPNSVVVLKL